MPKSKYSITKNSNTHLILELLKETQPQRVSSLNRVFEGKEYSVLFHNTIARLVKEGLVKEIAGWYVLTPLGLSALENLENRDMTQLLRSVRSEYEYKGRGKSV